MTKEEVRVVSIDKLNLSSAKTFLDIGGGTGSVSIEAAIRNKALKVYTMERNSEAVNLIRKNIEKFNIDNVFVMEQYAPFYDFTEKLDSVFIGGSGGNLRGIIKWVKELLNECGTLVINCIILETLNSALEILREEGFEDIEAIMMNVARLEKLGEGSYFKPLNPTYIISCHK